MWWFHYVPSRIAYIGGKSLKKLYGFFSIDLLLKTLFLPWKRDETDTSNLSLDAKFRVLLMNLVSRLVGATVRLGTVFAGLFLMAVAGISVIVSIVLFILSPAIAVTLILMSRFI